MSTAAGAEATVLSPWRSIWIRPRATMCHLLDTSPTYMVAPLAAFGGIAWAARCFGSPFGDDAPSFVAVALLISPLVGLAFIWLSGWLVGAIGRSFDGHGRARQLRAALAWGWLPATAAGLLWLLPTTPTPTIDVSPPSWQELVMLAPAPEPEPIVMSAATVALVTVLTALGVIGAIWSIGATVKTTAEAHGFSSGRALAVLLVAWLTGGLLIVLPVLGLVVFGTVRDLLA